MQSRILTNSEHAPASSAFHVRFLALETVPWVCRVAYSQEPSQLPWDSLPLAPSVRVVCPFFSLPCHSACRGEGMFSSVGECRSSNTCYPFTFQEPSPQSSCWSEGCHQQWREMPGHCVTFLGWMKRRSEDMSHEWAYNWPHGNDVKPDEGQLVCTWVRPGQWGRPRVLSLCSDRDQMFLISAVQRSRNSGLLHITN